jgi:hypothetical protein
MWHGFYISVPVTSSSGENAVMGDKAPKDKNKQKKIDEKKKGASAKSAAPSAPASAKSAKK